MTPIQVKILEALRSGKYKQTTGICLRKDDDQYCFCANGVVADLLGLTTEEWYDFSNPRWRGAIYRHKIFEFNSKVNEAIQPFIFHDLMWMNDFDKRDFTQIADMLEQRWTDNATDGI